MKRWIKWTAGSALLLGVIVVATAASGLYLAEQKRNRYIDIKPRPVSYTTDAQTIERGRYLYASRGCTDCHGAQGTGRGIAKNMISGVALNIDEARALRDTLDDFCAEFGGQ